MADPVVGPVAHDDAMNTSPTRRSPALDLRTVALLGATLVSGLAAGFFYTYEASVVRGLAEVSDPTYVETFQAINETVRNPVFGLVFFGTLPMLIVAAAANWGSSTAVRRGLLLAAPLLFLVAVAITATGNVSLNDDLAVVDIASTPGAVADARAAFEDDWNRLNLLRALASFGSFLAVAAALGTVAATRPVGQTG